MGYSTDHAPTGPQASQVVSLVINQVTYDSMIGQVSIPSLGFFNPQLFPLPSGKRLHNYGKSPCY